MPRLALLAFIIGAFIGPPVLAQSVTGAEIRALAEPNISMRIYALDPDTRIAPKKSSGFLQGFKIIGQAEVRNPATQRALLASFARGVDEHGQMAYCFDPHHAIRITREDGRRIDFLICFSCGHFTVSGWDSFTGASISKSPKPFFNQVWQGYGLPSSLP